MENSLIEAVGGRTMFERGKPKVCSLLVVRSHTGVLCKHWGSGIYEMCSNWLLGVSYQGSRLTYLDYPDYATTVTAFPFMITKYSVVYHTKGKLMGGLVD